MKGIRNKRAVSFILAFLIIISSVNSADLQVGSGWSFQRILKSANEGYHFFKGTLPLTNTTSEKMNDVSVTLYTLSDNNQVISKSDTITYGSIKSGNTVSRDFRIKKSIQFSTLKVDINYKVKGEKKNLNLFAAPGDIPGVLEGLRAINVEIERKRGKGYANFSARNYSTTPAKEPKITITLKLRKGKEKKIEIQLPVKEIAAGETKYLKKLNLGKIPSFDGYSVILDAKWPTPKEEIVVETVVEQMETEGGDFKFSALEFSEDKGQSNASITITSIKEELKTNTLKVSLSFTDKNGKSILEKKHTCKEAFPKGKPIKVSIPLGKKPNFQEYAIGIEF